MSQENRDSYRDIVLIDDHPIVLSGLKELVEGSGEFRVVAVHSSFQEAIYWFGSHRDPVLVVTDLALGGADGIELIKEVKAFVPDARILVFSMYDETVYARRVLRAGAHGYVMKDNVSSELMVAIRRVAAGGTFLSSSVSAISQVSTTLGAPAGVEGLSDRELAIFIRLGTGSSSKAIASELGISHKTVEAHRENIKRKLGVNSADVVIAEAARWIATNGDGCRL